MGDYNNPNESNGQQSNTNADQANQQPQSDMNQQNVNQESSQQESSQPQYNQPQYNQPQSNQPQNNQQYGGQPYGQPQYQPQNQQPQYQQPQYGGQSPYSQNQQNQYQQNSYQQNPYQQYDPYQQPQRKDNGMAIATLVCGIVSTACNCCFWYIALPAAIVGIILGIICLKNKKDGRTMAIVGIVLSAFGLLFGIFGAIATIAVMQDGGGYLNKFYSDFNWEDYY